MPTLIKRYRCNICLQDHLHESQAEACEATGSAAILPTGLVFADHTTGGFYRLITFAVARCVKDRYNAHYRRTSCWACRDNGAGDSLGDTTCGGGPEPRPEIQEGKMDPSHPTVARMVRWLLETGIEPLAYDDGEVVKMRDHSDTRLAALVKDFYPTGDDNV